MSHHTRTAPPPTLDRKRVDPSELMASSDVARLFGVTYAVLSNWKTRHDDFPRPVAVVANGQTDLYLRSDVLRYFRDRHPSLVQLIREEISR